MVERQRHDDLVTLDEALTVPWQKPVSWKNRALDEARAAKKSR